MYQNIIKYTLGLFLFVFLSLGYTNEIDSLSACKDDQTRYFSTLVVEEGTIKTADHGNFLMTLKKPRNSISQFSDRPCRHFRLLTLPELIHYYSAQTITSQHMPHVMMRALYDEQFKPVHQLLHFNLVDSKVNYHGGEFLLTLSPIPPTDELKGNITYHKIVVVID